MTPQAPLIVLFDGDCAFCNRWVRFLARRGGDDFRFAAQRSLAGARLLGEHGLSADALDTVVVLEDGRDGEHAAQAQVHVRAAAVRTIARRLGWPWRLASIVMGCAPPLIQDWAYRIVARNRHWLARGGPACLVPTAAIRSLFLPDGLPAAADQAGEDHALPEISRHAAL